MFLESKARVYFAKSLTKVLTPVGCSQFDPNDLCWWEK